MQKTPVPDEVRRFILTSVPSVPYLEALLLLRAEPRTLWDAHMLARRLYVTESQALDLLQGLHASGIAARNDEGRFYFAADEQLRQVLDALAVTYAANLVGVTDLVHSRLDKRAMQFADAFRFKKKEGS